MLISDIIAAAFVVVAVLALGFAAGFIVRPDVDEALQKRRRRHRAQGLLQKPFPRDYRDEFNQLRDSIPVDDQELSRAKNAR